MHLIRLGRSHINVEDLPFVTNACSRRLWQRQDNACAKLCRAARAPFAVFEQRNMSSSLWLKDIAHRDPWMLISHQFSASDPCHKSAYLPVPPNNFANAATSAIRKLRTVRAIAATV